MCIAESKLRRSDTIYKYAHLENPYIELTLDNKLPSLFSERYFRKKETGFVIKSGFVE